MEEKIKEEYPYVPDAVVIYLEKVFPNELPMEDITPRELGKKQGIQEVIRHLKAVKQWSEEKDV